MSSLPSLRAGREAYSTQINDPAQTRDPPNSVPLGVTIEILAESGRSGSSIRAHRLHKLVMTCPPKDERCQNDPGASLSCDALPHHTALQHFGPRYCPRLPWFGATLWSVQVIVI